ncbi:unnamed protein product (macronuclear) [Paramecium tetraurelia]|uniref:Uncharacterized protein n=1 Tax=Paramecium tetraurelia TaxID=5888 RepID=A0EGN2_PARTE|nr:uncharacterized protein GSPATT00026797001 [Paramecium tetraurelia]CAK94473.1 unnamed protein product [Paramecium tetraurelia]|eukprot:XP_001461846.1 hypothetical protein (macronuclear) [Paramecium tetraurelia strain d4-2]
MKSQNSKKPNLKITLNKKSMAQLVNSDKPPSSKCSQKTASSNGKVRNVVPRLHPSSCVSNSRTTSQLPIHQQFPRGTRNVSYYKQSQALEPDQSSLIQLLIQEKFGIAKAKLRQGHHYFQTHHKQKTSHFIKSKYFEYPEDS